MGFNMKLINRAYIPKTIYVLCRQNQMEMYKVIFVVDVFIEATASVASINGSYATEYNDHLSMEVFLIETDFATILPEVKEDLK